jgi:hypothetical protein
MLVVICTALLLHLGNGKLGQMKEPGEVNADDRRVVSLSVLQEGLADEDSGIVDERVDASEPRHTFKNNTLSV